MNNERMIAVSSGLIERAVSLLDLLPESGTIIELRAALATQPAVQVNPEPVAHLKVEVLGRITKVDIDWPNGLHTTLPTGKYPLYIVRGAEHDQ